MNGLLKFRIGDVIHAGNGGDALYFHDKELGEDMKEALKRDGVTDVEIKERNIEKWNDYISSGRISLPLDNIRAIAHARKAAKREGAM
jgi:hypothetical protein